MEFSGQYLTYDEYEELGGTLNDETPFNLLEFQARKSIDKYTFGRLINLEKQTQEVKLCVFNLINALESYKNVTNNETSKKNIASENIDGYSVSYANNISNMTEIVKGKDAEIENIIYTYLSSSELEDGTPYLYRGF